MQFKLAMEPELTGVKARLNNVLNLVRMSYQYGFVPYVIYLGKFFKVDKAKQLKLLDFLFRTETRSRSRKSRAHPPKRSLVIKKKKKIQ